MFVAVAAFAAFVVASVVGGDSVVCCVTGEVVIAIAVLLQVLML